MTGGHTGAISATGGRGSSVSGGGGGSGGRIAAYYNNRETEPFYGGVYETQGGGAISSAEPGASGTTFLNHVEKGYTTIRVDNKHQQAAGNEIENNGQELSLSGGSNSARTYSVPNGMTVSSSVPYSTVNYGYYIGRMFDDNPQTHFIARGRSTRITFDLKAVLLVNHIRIYPTCSNPSRFKVSSELC